MRLTDDTVWIGPCTAVNGKHMHVSVHLIDADDGWILVDTGSRVHRDVIDERLHDETDGSGPDAVLLTHTDFPHTGNLSWILDRWPSVDLYVGTSNPVGQNLPPDTRHSSTGETQEVCGRPFDVIDPPLADRSLTTWLFDRESGVMYTSDGFGYHHRPGECTATSRELAGGLDPEAVQAFHDVSLPWLRYVDPSLFREALDEVLDPDAARWLASTHGPPIAGEDVAGYLATFESAVERITAESTPE